MEDEEFDHFYGPDEKITSTRVRHICSRLAYLGLRQDSQKATAYIDDLCDQDLQHLVITKHAVAVHIQNCDYTAARKVLERANFDGHLAAPFALLDENVAVLALFSAWSDCATDFRVTEALAMVEEIDQIYMTREWHAESDFDSSIIRNRAETILQQRQLWSTANHDDLQCIITDTRIDMEDIPLHILWRACDAGIRPQKDFYERIQQRYPPILQYLSRRNRTLMHASCWFLWQPNQPPPISLQDSWEDYINTLRGPETSVIKAAALACLVRTCGATNLELAEKWYKESSEIYISQDCLAHMASLRLNHWRIRSTQPLDDVVTELKEKLQLAVTDSPELYSQLAKLRAISSDKQIKQRIESLFDIHLDLIKSDSTLSQTQTITEAISLAVDHPSLWPKVEEFMKPTLEQLARKGDLWNANIVQYRYYLRTAQIYNRAEEARAFFEKALADRALSSIPDFYVSACDGMMRSCTRMSDMRSALQYSLQEFNHPLCDRDEHRRSMAATRLAFTRRKLIEERIPLQLTDLSVKSLQRELDEIVALLDTYIAVDRVAGRTAAVREKSKELSSTLSLLTKTLKLTQYEQRWHTNIQAVVECTNDSEINLQPLMRLIGEQRWNDVVLYCEEELYQKVVKDPKMTMDQVEDAITVVVGALHSSAKLGDDMSEDIRKAMVLRQHALITSGLSRLREAENETFLLRAAPMMWTFVDLVKLFPDKKWPYVFEIAIYFEQAQDLCLSISRRITSEAGMQQWLRRRGLGAGFSFSHVCQVASEFFLKCELWSMAWSWIQRGRAQALRETLWDRKTARQRLLMSLENIPQVAELLAEEQRLSQLVGDIGTADYYDSVRLLEFHRRRMRTSPVLQEIVEGPLKPGTLSMDKVDDIWELKKHLPEGRGIVLVDWFIDTRSVIWRLDVSYDLKKHPRYTWGYIKPEVLHEWKRQYLNFPPGGLFPLEYRMKALHQLRPLLTDLQIRCKPGDLLVLSTPGELAGIPIHGIPFDGQIMIERNPVVYSGGLSLFEHCIRRARDRQPISLLRDAVFTSAYEQAGHETERAAIFSHLATTADRFGSKTLLGSALTVTGICTSLQTASWIHYHGHAYYAKTEALNQCLVLGRLSEEERQAQSRIDVQARLVADMPFEAPLSDREALLSSHLLDGSSRLTVADIFAMDLSTTAPVVMNIACDSGVQEFSAGNDPLGLVPALFCAGASSVVGTLWPIRSSTGRAFSKFFYDSLSRQNELQHTAKHFVNLAFAFQDAVIATKRIGRDPYSWAAFTLQGAPLYFCENNAQSAV